MGKLLRESYKFNLGCERLPLLGSDGMSFLRDEDSTGANEGPYHGNL